jgi:hypothetical protein
MVPSKPVYGQFDLPLFERAPNEAWADRHCDRAMINGRQRPLVRNPDRETRL